MATSIVHFLTLVGNAGLQARQHFDALLAIRRRARAEEKDEFEEDPDPLAEPNSMRDRGIVAVFCEQLLELKHELPALCYSQFVRNDTAPFDAISFFPPPTDRPRRLHTGGFHLAYYPSESADSLLPAIERKRETYANQNFNDGLIYLEQLRYALAYPHWLPSHTVFVIEHFYRSTRFDDEVEAAMNAPLRIDRPMYLSLRDGNAADLAALLTIAERAIRSVPGWLNETETLARLTRLRDKTLPRGQVTVLVANDVKPVGFGAMVGDRLTDLYVDPAQQRRRGGWLLTRHVLQRHDEVRVEIAETNPVGLSFLKRIGFQDVGRTPSPDGGQTAAVVHLRQEKWPQ